MEEIAVPGNEVALRKLGEIIGRGAIAFVGAGASAGLYPLWAELIDTLATEAVARGLATDKDREHWQRNSLSHPQQTVRGIRNALGDGVYGHVLHGIFRPRTQSDGSFFTDIQRQLLAIPFKGYVTTNYDPGLLEARNATRADSRATGFATWKDALAVRRWLTGDIFDDEPCPILFAHGLYGRSETIVLGVGEYREAYRDGPYRRLFDRLWGQDHLVFVGYGFSDPYLNFLASEVITRTAADMESELRHVAIVGLRSDQEYSAYMRRDFQDQYGAMVVFYRVLETENGDEDHGELINVLSQFEMQDAPPATHEPRLKTKNRVKPTPQAWIHETTDDERYVLRRNARRSLDRWADDPEVRVIAVTGLGGVGKTALVGNWLKKCGGDTRRPNAGLFYWSFYAERDLGRFFDSLLQFAREDLHVRVSDNESLQDQAVSLLRNQQLLVVLDGLEVLQEKPGTQAYGAVPDESLRRFLVGACHVRHESLLLLTSRFPFADLNPFLGLGLRVLDLTSLLPAESSALLTAYDVSGSDQAKLEVARAFDGHPLGLRVFAAALPLQSETDPSRLLHQVFSEFGDAHDQSLAIRLHRMLDFYGRHLPARKAALLGIVSLFRAPVEEEVVLTLASSMSGSAEVLHSLDTEEVRREIGLLVNAHMMQRDYRNGDAMYSCHPVLSSYFGKRLLESAQKVATDFVDLLVGRPEARVPETCQELDTLLNAIYVLLDASDVKRAIEMYLSRLDDGTVFWNLPAISDGLECTLALVATEDRRAVCSNQRRDLRLSMLAFFFNVLGDLSRWAGEPGPAAEFFRRCDEEMENGWFVHVANNLHCWAQALIDMGEIAEAEEKTIRALKLVRKNPGEVLLFALTTHARLHTIRGNVIAAREALNEAAVLVRDRPGNWHKSNQFNHENFVNMALTELLLRLSAVAEVASLVGPAVERAREKGWNQALAFYQVVLGRIGTIEGHPETAFRHFGEAEAVFRSGNMFGELANLLLCKARAFHSQERFVEAVASVDEAFRIAAARRMNLIRSEALAIRSTVLLDAAVSGLPSLIESKSDQLNFAEDDALMALMASRHSEFVWVEHASLVVLSKICRESGRREEARAYERDADGIGGRLQI